MSIHVIERGGEVRELSITSEDGIPTERYVLVANGAYVHIKYSAEGETITRKNIDALGSGIKKDLMLGASPEYITKKYGHREVEFEVWDMIGRDLHNHPIYKERGSEAIIDYRSKKTQEEVRGLRASLTAEEAKTAKPETVAAT